MREDFRNRLLNRYEEDPLWKKIGKALNRSAEDGTALSSVRKALPRLMPSSLEDFASRPE